jgi:hypothetical protein
LTGEPSFLPFLLKLAVPGGKIIEYFVNYNLDVKVIEDYNASLDGGLTSLQNQHNLFYHKKEW